MDAGKTLRRRLVTFPASGRGLGAACLTWWGNPPNMGICTACFERDIAGALGLHRFAPTQYLRPEIPAFVLGAFLAALALGEFKPRGGTAPVLRFMLGAVAMIGALIFLGCTWRVFLRLGGGDGSAVAGLAGMIVGVWVGAWFLKRGHTLGVPRPMPMLSGLLMPALMAGLAVLVLTGFTFGGRIFASAKGPGAMRSPIAASLGVGLLIGVLGQRSRFCTIGAVRDAVLIRNFRLLGGVAAMLLGAMAANLLLGQFTLGVGGMPVAHSNHVWNFLAMLLAGLAFCLAGGCPGRQLFLCGEGNTDASVFVLGTLAGAAVAHNWGLTAAPDKTVEGVLQIGGPGPYGKVAVIVGLVFCLAVAITARQRKERLAPQ